MNQCDIILDMIKKGWVTPLDALREAGCFRLQARIHDLCEAGYAIERGWHEYESQYGKKKVRKYRLAKQAVQGELFGQRPDFDYTCECGYYVCSECGYPAYPMEICDEDGNRCPECGEGTMEKAVKK